MSFSCIISSWTFLIRNSVQDALAAVQTILDTTRHPVVPEDSDHTYEDKYALVDTMTNVAIAASISVLERLGLSLETLEKVLAKVHLENKPLSLHFQMEQSCTFVQETERKVTQSEIEFEMTANGEPLASATNNVKVKSTVKEYHWNFTAPYTLVLRIGDSEEIQLASREDMTTSMIVLGSSHHKSERRPPPPFASNLYHYEVSLTWLVQKIALRDGKPTSQFSVDRLQESCKTPRRNEDIGAAWDFGLRMRNFAQDVENAFRQIEYGLRQVAHEQSEFACITDTLLSRQDRIFDPIIPLFENNTVLPQSDYNLFLSKHATTLDTFIEFGDSTPSLFVNSLISKKEGVVLSMFMQFSCIFQSWFESIQHVEDMLYNQMVQAIGKQLTPEDFDEFIFFYSKRLFAETYVPGPLSYAIGRKNHYPEGMLSIERSDTRMPIHTIVRRIPADTSHSLMIPVDAATAVEIRGDCFVHGWIQYRWGGFSDHLYQRLLVARAHQFSSFMVVLGVMGPSNTFLPKSAIILQNKDEVLIPLISKMIPSAKEFTDSIKSLSPEQRAFAETYRRFQLESSVFGVCVIQIKPQLEKLLDLPDGALTKEIELTQDLMSLFVDYHIPSDLLSYDGLSTASTSEKVTIVKGYVKAVVDVIDAAKAKQLQSERQRAKIREEMAAESTPESNAGAGPMVPPEVFYAAKLSAVGAARAMSSTAGQSQKRRILEYTDMADFSDEFSSLNEPVREERPESSEESPSSTATTDDSSSPNDFTMIPRILDSVFQKHDKGGALKSTIIKTQDPWHRLRQENLLVKSQKTTLNNEDVASETGQAMDLLRAISRSGSLSIESSELHVVVAVSHCFENHIMETLIEGNINPIAKVERSMLLIASVIHGVSERELLGDKPQESIDGGGDSSTLI